MLTSLVSALVAAVLSYGLNSYGLKRLGRGAITFEGPAAEEVLKTGAALFLGAHILYTHIIFGVLEGAFDAWSDKRRGQPLERGALAALLSLLGHSLFGVITIYGTHAFGFWQAGVLLAVLLHSVWNRTLLR